MRKTGNSGFTLVELLVGILCGTLILTLTVTVLLFGMRMRSNSAKTALQQQRIQTLQTVIRKIAEEKQQANLECNGDDSWEISDSGGNSILRGQDGTVFLRDGVLLEGISSIATLNEEGTLLTVTLEEGRYQFTVHTQLPWKEVNQ